MATVNDDKFGNAGMDTVTETPGIEQNSHSDEELGRGVTYKAWMYKPHRIGPITIPCYASPAFQLGLVALVCFLCPGTFNALNGLGGGGQLSATVNNNSNIALNATFSVCAFFSGSFANRLGIRLTLSLGGIGYFIFVTSWLSYNINQNAGFCIFAGALLGLCAGLLWCAQGAIMMSYPSEANKGRYISWFWMVFNLGGVIGSLVPLGQNIHSKSGTVSNGTYVGFMVLTFLGAALAWALIDARQVQRNDGSRVVLMKNPSWKSEIFGLFECLRTDVWVILLFPMFFASNWFYTYQFNDVNLAKFNIRTRSLNSTLYWTSQIISACIFGFSLDIKSVRRSTKAKAAWVVLFVLTMAIWGGGYAWQKTYTRAETAPKGYVKMDFSHSGYVGPMFLYMFYGFYDAAWQTCVYWFMGALTNNGRKLANFAGFYKGIQSAGAAIISAIDNDHVPYMNEFASSWGLLVGALLIAAPLIMLKVQDSVPVEEDLKFSDESLEDVKPTILSDVHETHDVTPDMHEKI